MNIKDYLDSTYLKTPEQSGLSQEETFAEVLKLTDEAVAHELYAVMIRPEFVRQIRQYLTEKNSSVKLGTVIGFHEGTYSVEEKLREAAKAVADGADELDFVLNYEAFLAGNTEFVKEEVLKCTAMSLENGKIAKWIIECAALSDGQIADITSKISQWITAEFPGKEGRVFVKSSTGFYQTQDGKPNGATFEAIRIMLDNAGSLPVKAAGGVRTRADAEKMIAMGVKRIGTSSALSLISEAGEKTSAGY